MSENTRKPLSEQHPAWQAALMAPYEMETEQERTAMAVGMMSGPPIPGERVTQAIEYGAKCARYAIMDSAAIAEKMGATDVAAAIRASGHMSAEEYTVYLNARVAQKA